MPGRKQKRLSLGANQIAPILPGPAAPSAAAVLMELKGAPRAEMIKHLSSFTTHDSTSSLRSLRILSTQDSWSEEFRRVGVFKRAFRAVFVMVRNAYISIGCALPTNYLCNIGTLSTKPPKEQSYTRFLAVTMLWTHFFFCWVVHLTQACFLMHHRFLENPDQPPTSFFCLRRLYSKTYISYCISLMLLMVTTYGVGKLLPIELRKYKLEFYLACLSGHDECDHLYAQRSLPQRFAYFAKVYANFAALAFIVVFCGGFVRVIHNYHITSYVKSAVFVGGCTTIKFFVQEVMKMCVFSKKEKDIRQMWITIGVPTVLIDTQLRIALRGCDSLEITLTGLASMVCAEIVMRAVKAVSAKPEIRRHEKRSYPTTVSAAIQQFCLDQSSRQGPNATTVRLERWKERTVSFHTADIYAGMAAQYIAIGCSASILFFYWSHPGYELRFVKYQGALNGQHEIVLEWSLFALLNVQLVAEVIADYLSSLLEIGAGIDFEELRKYRAFVACIFVCMATVNVQISAIIYMRVD